MEQVGESSIGRARRFGVGIGLALLVAALVVAPAASAQAGPLYSVYPTGQTAVTAEYGSPWNFQFQMSRSYPACNCSSWFVVTVAGSAVPFARHASDYGGDSVLFFSNFTSNKAPLPVGKYTFSIVHHRSGSIYGFSSSPVTLTVVPTKLTTSVDIQPDPNHTAHAILSATATGALIDNAANYGYGEAGGPSTGVARMPAGTWQFTVNNTAGRKVYAKAVRTAENTPPFASAYWTSVPAGKTFGATVTFIPDEANAKNLSVASAVPVSYTSVPPPRSEVLPTPTPVAPIETKASGYEIPVWAAGLWGLVFLGLLIALIALVIRLARRPASAPLASPEGQDDVL